MEPKFSQWCLMKWQEGMEQDEIKETSLEYKKIFFIVRVAERQK